MKLIKAVIRPGKLEEVKAALLKIGIEEFMECAIVCHGRHKGQTMIYRGVEYVSNFAQKVKLEILAADDCVGKVIEVIGNIARTQRMEDCRIYILPSLETGFCAVPC